MENIQVKIHNWKLHYLSSEEEVIYGHTGDSSLVTLGIAGLKDKCVAVISSLAGAILRFSRSVPASYVTQRTASINGHPD